MPTSTALASGTYLLIQGRNTADRGDLVSAHPTMEALEKAYDTCGSHARNLTYDRVGDADYRAPRGA